MRLSTRGGPSCVRSIDSLRGHHQLLNFPCCGHPGCMAGLSNDQCPAYRSMNAYVDMDTVRTLPSIRAICRPPRLYRHAAQAHFLVQCEVMMEPITSNKLNMQKESACLGNNASHSRRRQPRHEGRWGLDKGNLTQVRGREDRMRGTDDGQGQPTASSPTHPLIG